MKTTGYLIPEVRAALRRGDCDQARMLVGDAQHGRLTARQQTTVTRLLRTVARCEIKHGGVGAPKRRYVRQADRPARTPVKFYAVTRSPWKTVAATTAARAREIGDGFKVPFDVHTDTGAVVWTWEMRPSGVGRAHRRRR